MNTTTAAVLARTLMREHGLVGWTFKFDRAKRRFGACHYSTRTISLSEPLVRLNDEAVVRNTILHEIAHALVGYAHGHNYVWRSKARAIGCDGKRCYEAEAVVKPAATWQGTCPSCGVVAERHRLTDKVRQSACGRCCKRYARGRFDARFRFVWSRQVAA